MTETKLIQHIIRSAEIMRATAEGVYGRKSSSKCERKRQLAICLEQRDFLKELIIPDVLDSIYKSVLKRLDDAIECEIHN